MLMMTSLGSECPEAHEIGSLISRAVWQSVVFRHLTVALHPLLWGIGKIHAYIHSYLLLV